MPKQKFKLTTAAINELLEESFRDRDLDLTQAEQKTIADGLARRIAFHYFLGLREVTALSKSEATKLTEQLKETFGEKVKVEKGEHSFAVEVEVDGITMSGKVLPEVVNKEPKLVFVPFPVSTTGDPELIWELARLETLTQEEASVALARVSDDFWASKKGQKLLSKRVERTFAEFINRVPTAALKAAGIKRHYKESEPVKKVEAAHYVAKVTDRYVTGE